MTETLTEDPKVKTPEELRTEREARFRSDPNSFIELSEVICMAINSPASGTGVSVLVGKTTRTKLDIGQIEINHILNKTRLQMDMVKAMNNTPPPPGSMRSFARKMMRR